MTRRSLRLAALAVLLTVPLSACSQAGTAATINGDQITIADVDHQVDKFFAEPALAAAGKGHEALVRKRSLNALILLEIFRTAAKNEGTSPTAEELATTQEAYKKSPGQVPGPLQGAPTDLAAEVGAWAAVLQKATSEGAKSEEEANNKFTAAVQKAARETHIEMNPRYGSFDVATFLRTFSIGAAKDKAVIDLPAEQPPAGEQVPQEGQQGGEQPPAGEQPG